MIHDMNEDAALTVGQRLRLRRDELGLTIRDVAAITKIQASHLGYLEEDRFEEFPGEVFARGFLKNYARELRLDEAAMLEAYERQTGRTTTAVVIETSPVLASEAPAHRFAQPATIGRVAYAVGLAVFVVGLAMSVLIFGGDDTARSASYAPTAAPGAWQPVAPVTNDWQTYREN